MQLLTPKVINPFKYNANTFIHIIINVYIRLHKDNC